MIWVAARELDLNYQKIWIYTKRSGFLYGNLIQSYKLRFDGAFWERPDLDRAKRRSAVGGGGRGEVCREVAGAALSLAAQ